MIDEKLPHFLTILQEGDKVSIFQSFSYPNSDNRTKFCSYSLKDYLTKNAEDLFSQIVLDKSTRTRSSLLERLESKGFHPKN